MKSIKRLLSITAAMLITCTVFGGCGQTEDESSSQSTSSEPQSAAPAITLPPAVDDESSAAESSSDSSEGDESSDSQATQSDNDSTESDAPQSADDSYKPLLWQATSPEGKTIKLMGSMHALREDCYPLPDYVQSAYDEADVLAVECDISNGMDNLAAMLKYSDRYTYPQGETLADHISEETWEGLKSYIEAHGQPIDMYETMQAWYIFSAIQTFGIQDAELDSNYGLDMQLLLKAHEDEKEIYQVESYDFQLELFMELSDETYDMLLTGYSAENSDAIKEQLLDTYDAWRTGDEAAFAENSDDVDLAELDEHELELYEHYNDVLIYDRNEGMAEKAEELVNSGDKAFFVVGLAHFVGKGGILDLLEQDGYTIEKISE